MPYYKDTENNLHFLSQQDVASGGKSYLPLGCVEVEAPVPAAPTLDELKAAKLNEINAICEKSIAVLRAGYPDSEVLSWSKQENEARAFVADANAATPLLDALATARGIGKADLAGRVIAKADTFAALSGALIGKRQGLEDQIAAATTKDVLDGVAWAA